MGTTTNTLRTPASGNNTWGFVLQLEMSATTDVTTNKSTITWALKLYNNGSYGFSQYGIGWEVNINGVVGSHDRGSSDRYTCLNNGDVLTLQSGSTTVQHNTDGTKTISCSASIDMANRGNPSSAGAGAGPMSINATNWTLEAIPRASTMTVPSFTIGTAGTMTISMASSSFSHTITYSFSGLTGTAASVNAGVSSASWTPPTTFYAKLPNSTSGTVSLVLNTYSGSTLVGSKSYTATVSVGSSIKPTAPSITLSPVNTNAWINSQGLYVGGYTKLRVQSSATPGTGATSISSYTISGAFSATGADVTSSSVLSAGSKSVKVTAADTRGRTNSTTTTVTFLTYSVPSFSTFKAYRGTYQNGTWTQSSNGNHIRVEAVGSVSLSSQGNTGSITVKIGNTNPSATSGNYYYFTSTNNTTSYTVTGTITDQVGKTTTRTLTVSTVEVPLNINVDLPGVGVGKISETAHLLDLAPAWRMKGREFVSNATPTFTRSGGNGTASGLAYYRAGNVCQLKFNISTAAVSVGSNLWEGTVTNIDNPIEGVVGVSYYSSTVLVAFLNSSGNLTVRVLGADLVSGGSTTVSIVYITSV